MRFYNITLTNSATGAQVLPSSLGGLPITSLLPNGNFNPAALNIDFELPVGNATVPGQNARLRIWGLSLADIQQATKALSVSPTNPTPTNITVRAGMSKGLPLAKPAQQGVIVSGSILQAWGNRTGTEQTLTLTFAPHAGSPRAPQNYQFAWPQGTPLPTAIQNTLQIVFPGKTIRMAISPNLVLPNTETGTYQSAYEFATYLYGISQKIANGSGTAAVPYLGLHIAFNGDVITVFDGTQPPSSPPKKIAFEDMIGQPVLNGSSPNDVVVQFVLRGDLDIGDVITLPPSLATQTQQSNLQLGNANAITTGDFTIMNMIHYGNFRQPTSDAWNTTVQCVRKTA